MGCKVDPAYPPYKRFLLTTMKQDSMPPQASLPAPSAAGSQEQVLLQALSPSPPCTPLPVLDK